jgi:molybdopterin/thiamine biosynthesis adenylyltransferase
MLPEIDMDGQSKLLSSKVAIIGLGGLGSPCAIYLAASGIGSLTLIDHDSVELSNLQRQIIYSTEDIGEKKSLIAKSKLLKLNQNNKYKCYENKVSENNINEMLSSCEFIVDCSDNFETRKLINKYCYKNKKKLILGSCMGWKGQILTFNFTNDSSPCYECFFEDLEGEDISCRESSILSPLAGVIGSYLSIEVIKSILNIKQRNEGFMQFDSYQNSLKLISFSKNPSCKICSKY